MSGARTSGERGYAFGEFFFDVEGHSLLRDGQEVALRPRSFRVLHHLLVNHGRLVTRDELMQAVWGDTVVTEGSLTQCIIDIRRAIGDTDQQMIRTVPREGYVFDLPVTESPPGAPGTGAAARKRTMLPAMLALAAIIAVAAVLVWRLADHGSGGVDTSGPPPAKSIAVLPFADMGPDGDRQYFADGLSEEILNRLAQVRELKVIARTSSFSLRDRPDLDAVAIGRLLNVSYLLEGSVRHSGDRLRVTAQLIETGGGTHLWSESYDGGPGDALEVQARIAGSVAGAMRVALDESDGVEPPRQPLPAAYDAYARAHHLHARRKAGDLQRAKKLYLEAIRLDPGYAKPWAGLAGLYMLDLFDREEDYDTVLELMGNAARTGVSLDPTLAEAHARLGRFHALSGNQELAMQHLERARELNPNSSLVIGLQAGRAGLQGRYEEALALQRRAVEVDPLSHVNRHNMVGFLLFAGRYDEAEAELAELAALHGDDAADPTQRFRIYLLQGRLDEARAVLGSVLSGAQERQSRALLHGAAGELAEAEAAMQELREQETSEAALLLAEVHAYRGEPGPALRWLETSYRRLGPAPTASALARWYLDARLSPFLQELRHEPAARPYLVDSI
ncbi:winged helix-turn-helix domain-containing tetratricopeptide repeat protein [Lentisalinibacter salinarum]|uniref:winged helix-turn-helix domain-containing tetratricopeptide repeat protein n=1 Tax=Lentisalinibacter salinarum TaxID=2992239 RepID=UPI00386ACD78